MDSTLKAALKAGGAMVFDACKLVYPDHEYRLTSAGSLTINSEVYDDGDDSDGLGTIDFNLSHIEEYADGTEGAPRCRIVLLCRTQAALDALSAPDTQWSRVYAWWGALSPETGQLIGEAERPFIGYTDLSEIEITEEGWTLTLDCASGLDQALDAGEGQRFSNAFHQICWPGELGMDGVTGLTETIWWGMYPPAGTQRGSSGGGLIGRLAPNRRTNVL